MNTLHYIFDPLCGWCYAAAPLIDAARQAGLHIELHAGGLWTGANVKHVTPQLRQYVMSNDQRIAQLTGQPFGDAYFDVLLNDSSAVLDSEPPIRAIIAAQDLGLDMLHHIQQAHFVEGLHISRFETLSTIAQKLGLNADEFRTAYDAVDFNAAIAATHALMAAHGAQGYPTLLINQQRIEHSQFYGHAAEFGAALESLRA